MLGVGKVVQNQLQPRRLTIISNVTYFYSLPFNKAATLEMIFARIKEPYHFDSDCLQQWFIACGGLSQNAD